jgi:hypothetical protein
MDIRHYDTIGHGLEMAYEDWKQGWDDPLGAANTHELTLWALAGVPTNAQLVGMEKTAAEPALLVATPEYYHANRAFGFWSLPDRSTPPGARSKTSWITPSISITTRWTSAAGMASGTTAT